MKTATVGVIGLGAMGMGMAKNALAAGLRVKGYDLSAAARDAFAERGGEASASVEQAAVDAEVLAVMVVNAAQLRQVLFGEGGAAKALPRGAVVMMCCTVAPKESRDIGQRLLDEGLEVLDAPVSGGKVGAEAGTLSIMASGSQAAFESCQPFLDAVAGTVYRVGDEPGQGATYKVVHQLAAGVHLAVAAEVMAFAAHAGCDTDVVADIVSNSAGSSWMFRDRAPHMLDSDFSPRSTVDIFVKDLGLVIETGQETKTPLPLAAAAHQLFLAASSMGHGPIDDSAVVKVYESATGSPVKRQAAG